MFEGTLNKMFTEKSDPINYFLKMDNGFIHMNQLIGKKINISYTGSRCLNCHKDIILFRQGFCKTCFFEIPSAGDWIMRPELSKAHLGVEDRDLEYEKKIQLQPHVIYLALSSHLKVGITRKSQLPTRWIDQGAHEAITLLEVPNRFLSGVGEVALKNYYSDKTNWRKMLQNESESVSWNEEYNKALDFLPNELKPYIIRHDKILITEFIFPVDKYPTKVKSLNLSKTPNYVGKLTGIKGQYLIFDDQTVFNIRSNEGQKIKLIISN